MRHHLLTDIVYRPVFFAALALIALISVFVRVRPLLGEREMITIHADGGFFSCDRGIYVFHVSYEADNAVSMPIFTRDEEDHILLISNGSYLLPSRTTADIRLYVKEDNTMVQFYTHEMFEDSHARVDHADVVYRPGLTACYYAIRTLVPFAVLCGILLFVRMFGHASGETKRIVLSLCGIIFFISLPLFVEYTVGEQDYYFHMNRIGAIAQGLENGSFPVRLYPFFYNDYGYPPGVMYGDLLLYAPALLHLLGIPLWRCYQLFCFAVNTATVVISWHAFRKISGNAVAGIFGSALYSTSMYGLVNMYYRTAVGEYCAMAFIPLVLLGFWLLFGERPEDALVYMVTGFTGLIQTHILSTLMVFVFGFLLCLLCVRQLLRLKRLPVLMRAAGLTLLLNAGFIVPFMDYYLKCDLVINHSFQLDPGNGASIPQLFMTEYAAAGGGYGDPLSVAGEMPVTPGLAMVLILVMAFCFILLAQKTARLKRICICFGFGLTALFMGTRLFPYAAIERMLPWLYAVIGKNLQFPSRYFVIVIPLACMAAVLLFLEYEEHHTGRAAVMVMAGLIMISLWQGLSFMSRRLNETEGKQALSVAEIGNYGDMLYLFSDADGWEAVRDRTIQPSSQTVSVTEESRAASAFQYTVHVKNEGEQDGWIDFPVWNYPHYVAKTASGAGLLISDGENHRVRVTVPASLDEEVTVRFREPWYWRVAELASVATALALYGIMSIMRKGKGICFKEKR